MNLTTVGKIALFANLALSLMFAFWGFGIYSQRINWTNTKLGERDGEYTKRDAQIKRLNDARARVEARWLAALKSPGGVLALEAVRPTKQDWYRKQLEVLRTGGANERLGRIEFEQGRIKIDPKTGLPVMSVLADETKQPIPSLQVLNDTYTRVQRDVVAATEQIEKLEREEQELTQQLGDGKVAGLHFDLAQQQLVEKHALDEQEYLQPLLYNSMVEQQSLENRQKALEDRVKRLQALSVAKQP